MLGAKASRTLTEGQVTQAIILWLRTVPSSSGQPGLDFLYVGSQRGGGGCNTPRLLHPTQLGSDEECVRMQCWRVGCMAH